MEFSINQIIKKGLLIGRNGPYKHIASVTNLIKRGQLKARRVTTPQGTPGWSITQEEITKFNKTYDKNS